MAKVIVELNSGTVWAAWADEPVEIVVLDPGVEPGERTVRFFGGEYAAYLVRVPGSAADPVRELFREVESGS